MSAPIVPPTSMRDRAVALALGDFRVFKLLVNGKTPAVEKWQLLASNDPVVVRKMWTDHNGESLDNNIGVVTGGDFFVADVDVKDGKPGLETLETLVDLGLDTHTQLVRSPTGSLHFYYKKPAHRKVVTYAEKHLGPGIDTRGEGGYVVGAGSEINGEAYECLDASEMLEAPEWMLARCKPAERSTAADVAVLGESDTEANILRAIDYLTKRAPEAVEGSGGNAQTYNIACEVIGFGVSEPETFQLMLLHWNDDKAHPPWAPEELERIVGNAARYRQEPEGNRSAAADFGVVEDQEAPAPFTGPGDQDPSDLWEEDNGFPADLAAGILPKVMESWVRDEATRKGVNFGVAALPALIVCAASIPARFEVQVKQNDTGHTEHAILWAANVGRPSARKTPVSDAMARPLRLINEQWASRNKSAADAHRAAMAAWKRDSKGTDTPPPPEPPRRIKIISDTTTEAVVRVLSENPHGLLNLQDELSQWAGNMDAYRPGKAVSRDAGYWLQTKSGNPYQVERVSRDTPDVAVNAVHIFGNIQPSVIQKLAADWGGSGMMQRFLLVNAPHAAPAPDLAPDMVAQNAMYGAIRTLVELAWCDIIPPFMFTPGADGYRRKIVDFADREISDGGVPVPIEGWLGKIEGEWARIALVMHFVEWATGVDVLCEELPPQLIGADVAERAYRFLVEFQYPQQQYFYRTVAGLGAAGDAEALKIAKRILAKGSETLHEREIAKWIETLNGPEKRNLRLDAVNTLVMHKWLSPSGLHRSGTHINKWDVNPAVHDGRFASQAEAERTRLAVMKEKRNGDIERRRIEKRNAA